MTALALLAVRGLVRAPGPTAIRVLTLAAAVALLGAMLLFVGHSLRTMTSAAVRSVPLHWQGPVDSYGADVRLTRGVAGQPGVLQASATATAPLVSASHRTAVATIRAGAGAMLAVPSGYLSHIRTFRFLRGTLRPGQIVLDQQLAATLQAQPGDEVALETRRGAAAHRFRVSGVALITAPDVLFQPLVPLLGPAPAQPPANVVILPVATFARTLAPELRTVSPGTVTIPGTPAGIQWQVQAQVDPQALTGSPLHARRQADRVRNAVARSLTGRIAFVDNLSEGLNAAAGDALYAQTLYIMLAVPGALVALALAFLAALGTADRDRRDLALLRARGASRRDLVVLAGAESVAVGLVAGALGTGLAFVAVRAVGAGGGLSAARIGATLGVCVGLAVAGAGVARAAASISALRLGVSEGRRPTRRARRPLWQRLYLDWLCLAVSGLVYWLTARTGFSAVVNPDSNPTLSLSVYMFFAPALLWLGGALLLLRLRGRALAWGAGRAAAGRESWVRFLLASAGRRGEALNRGLLVVGLLLAFGVQLAVFAATYDQQARVDAQLTLGADVVVRTPPGVIERRGLLDRIAGLPGTAGVSAVDHAYAYVGPDLQDTFGIDPATIGRATKLRSSYFVGASAGAVLRRLAATRDGVLVSRETITDYALRIGDLLKLRVFDRATGRLRVARFHVVGIVQEFPAAPRDSFMVANLAYLERVTHDPGPNVVFVRAAGDPVAVARRIAAATRRDGTIVEDIRQQSLQTVSSITTVDLDGISRIEEVFALMLAAAAMGLFVAVGIAERRQELATMAALGASLRRIASFLWTEAAIVLVAAMAVAALLGWLLAQMLVAMLRHVFDPPPDHLAAPWGYLAALGGAAIVGAAVAVAVAMVGIRRMPLGAILREE